MIVYYIILYELQYVIVYDSMPLHLLIIEGPPRPGPPRARANIYI